MHERREETTGGVEGQALRRKERAGKHEILNPLLRNSYEGQAKFETKKKRRS